MSESLGFGGIDCGKRSLDVGVFPGSDKIKVANTPKGHQILAAWLTERGISVVGLEASGGYERSVRDALLAVGVTIRVFDPARVRFFAKAKGRRAKNDTIDAAVIAEFTAMTTETPALPTVPMDREREEIAGLINARRLLVDKRADVIRAIAHAPIPAQEALTRAADALASEIATLDAAIRCAVDVHPVLIETTQCLLSAPGIGLLTAVTLAVRLPELGHVSGAKIAALVGIAPFDHDSGIRCGQRHIGGGRADVRRALYMAALTAATHAKGVIADFYKHLIESGKKPKVALVACMRKLLVCLNAMLAKGEVWAV
jgi:transposase